MKPCPSPGCLEQLYHDPNSPTLKCPMHGPMEPCCAECGTQEERTRLGLLCTTCLAASPVAFG